MEADKKVFQMVVSGDILSEGLPQRLEIDQSLVPVPEEQIYYELLIEFSDARLYETEKIMTFPSSETVFRKKDSFQERVGNLLSQQLEAIEERFISLKYSFWKATISGEVFDEKEKIVISICEGKKKEFNKKGDLVKQMKLHAIVPSAKYTEDLIVKLLSEQMAHQIKQEFFETKRYNEHTPNWVESRILFEAVARGLTADEKLTKKNKELRIVNMRENLACNYTIEKEWPLMMTGCLGGDPLVESAPFMADCSEWLVFVLKKNQKWSITAMDSIHRVKLAVENALRDKNTLAVGYDHRNRQAYAHNALRLISIRAGYHCRAYPRGFKGRKGKRAHGWKKACRQHRKQAQGHCAI